jgi:hypothetical protein
MFERLAERIRTSGAFSPGKVLGDYVVNQILQLGTTDGRAPTREDPSSSIGQTAVNTLLPKMGPFREIVQLNFDLALSGKTLSAWAGVTDAKEPQPRQVLAICELILEQALGGHWEIRRLIARIAGTALSEITEGKDLSRSLDLLREVATPTQEGRIFLATALAQAPHALALSGSPVAALLSAVHPQIPWQIVRNPDCLRRVLADPTMTAIVSERTSDRWLRRQLIATICNLVQGGELLDPPTDLLQRLVREEVRDAGPSYLYIVRGAEMRAYASSYLFDRASLACSGSERRFKQNKGMPDLVGHKTSRGISRDFGLEIDLACLRFDLGGGLPDFHGLQGRYGMILDMIRPSLLSTASDTRRESVESLLACESEGVRWGVAHLLPDLARVDESLHHIAVTRLLDDWHPWVLREVIEMLGKTPDVLKTERGLSYVRTILVLIEKLAESSSPITDDIKKAFVMLLSTEIGLVELVSIRLAAQGGHGAPTR